MLPQNGKYLVFGLGVSSLSAIKLLCHAGPETFVVNQGPCSSWPTLDVPEDHCFEQTPESFDEISTLMSTMNAIIISPGIPLTHPLMKKAGAKGVEIYTEIELAYRYLLQHRPEHLAPIIAVTGTNGKTTTTTMIGELFKAQGVEAFIGGNIGVAFCDYALSTKKADAIALELSSFQLESIKFFQSDVSLILNLSFNHGERYETLEEYGAAKWRITEQTKTLIYDDSSSLLLKWSQNLASQSNISLKILSALTEHKFYQKLKEHFRLPGHHNFLNLCCAFEACAQLALLFPFASKLKFKDDHSLKFVQEFCGVEHRFEYVPTHPDYGLNIFNDAKSTNWDATLTALHSLNSIPSHQNIYLILGGQKRGQGDAIGEHMSAFFSLCQRIYLIGETADDLATEIKSYAHDHNQSLEVFITRTLEQTLTALKNELATYQSTPINLLFSPAYPSFDQFKNYKHRGEVFKNLIKNIF